MQKSKRQDAAFAPRLFLGFAPDAAFNQEIAQGNPYLLQLLVGREEYLQEIVHEGITYLGKALASYPTIEQLGDAEQHLLSLLHKLAPDYSFVHNPPVLVTLIAYGE
jgi:hypothetical protein